MSKKLLGMFAGLVLALGVMVAPVAAEEANLNDMTTEQLIALIQQLLSGSSTTTTTPATTGTSSTAISGIPSGFQFNTNLKLGMTGNDVKYLQIVLNSDSATAVATTGTGSAGNESTYFGAMTQAAVVKFQEKYASVALTPLGLTKGTGFVGAGTRTQLNTLLATGTTTTPVSNLPAGCTSTSGFSPVTGQACSTVSTLPAGCTSTTGFSPVTGQSCAGGTTTPVVTPVTGSGMTVALASDSPSTTLVEKQAIAPLAKFVLTNKDSVEAKITKVELQRIGVSADTTLSNVYLFNGETRLTDAATISQGKVTFNNPTGVITIPAGQSVIVTVASDIAASSSGQTIGVSLIGLTSNVEVKSTLPLQGGVQTIATANLATVAVDNTSILPSGSPSVNAGTTNFTVFSAPLTIGVRAVNLKGVTLKAIGSIPNDALENIQLYVNGIAIGNSVSLTSDGLAKFVLDTPYEIKSSSTLEVRADVVKGSSRSFSLSLQNASDLVVVDSVYNVNVTPTGIPASTASISVNTGTVSVSLDSTYNTTTVTKGTSNVTVAKYNFKAFGEDVKISYLDVTPSTAMDNVVIYANGAAISTNQNYTSTKLHFSLGSSLIIPANTVVSVEVKADTKVAGVDIPANTSISATLDVYANNAQGVSSSSLFSVPLAPVAGQSLKIGAGNLVLAKNSSFSAGTITPNTANQRIGSFVVQAGDAEGVRINSISAALGFGASNVTLSTATLSNLYIKYNGVSSTPVNPQASNNFSTNVELSANQAMTIDVYADVAGATTNDEVVVTLGASVTGLSSNSVITVANLPGQKITAQVAALADPVKATSSPAAQFALAGSEGVAAEYKFVATDGDITINKIVFATDANNTIVSVTVAGKTAYVVGGTATVSGLSYVVPAGYAGKTLPVTVTYNNVGATGITTNQDSTLTITSVEFQAGNTIITKAPLAVAANTMVLVGGIPTVNLTSDNRTGLTNGEVKLADITVSANQNGGAIQVKQLPISVTSTGAVTIDGAAGNNIVVKDAAGNVITTTNTTGLTVATGATGTDEIVFPNAYNIEAGASQTFSIYSTAKTVGPDSALTTKLGAKSSFQFFDVDGNLLINDGSGIYNYSSNTSTIHN